jgi:hypothetical protein
MSDENKCAICWEEIGEKNKSVMNCGHSFHFSCITTNILKGNGDQSMNCPLCRELIVDKEFEDCCVEIVHDDDTDSIPELEEDEEDEEDEEYDLWSGPQLWRRDLALRDRVKIAFDMDTTGEMLNRMGWDINDDDIITTRYDGYEDRRAVIFCEVVRIATEPHEESEGLAPFLLKPLELRPLENQNRLQIQAYRPKQSEVLDIELSVEWRDEPLRGFGHVTQLYDEEQENQWHLEALQEEIKNEQIFEKEISDLMNLVSSCFESLGCRKDLYTRRTVHSIVHKVTVDVIKAFKDEKIKRIQDVEERIMGPRAASI